MKTAGTSLEVHLAARCDREDIITKISPSNPAHVPRNFVDKNGRSYFNHMPASLIRDFQPDAFASFFKFCFERHPVDKCLSHFAMLKNSKHHADTGNPKTWTEYIEQGNFPVDTSKYVDEGPGLGTGKIIVDKIYRYEDFGEAIKDISVRTGIADGPVVGREKSEFRYGVPSFDEVMAKPRDRARIFEAFESSLKFTPY